MPLVRRCRIPLALENMPEMASAVRAHNLCTGHAEGRICVSGHSTGDRIEICWPSTATLKLVIGCVERRIAGGAGIDTGVGHVLVVLAGEGGLGAFFAEDAELFCARVSDCVKTGGV